MLVISQRAWTSDDQAALARHVGGIAGAMKRFAVSRAQPPLILLPQATASPKAPDKAVVLKGLGQLASANGVFLAAAALVKDPAFAAPIVTGFLLGPNGETLIDTPKISPEWVNGLAADQTCAMTGAAKLTVAKTPLGQIGLLTGEDILLPHVCRALVFKGAEIVLNPAAEINDGLLESRNNARSARCFENTIYVATASAAVGTFGDDAGHRPPAASFADWTGKRTEAGASEDFIKVDFDLDKLRRRRTAIFSIQPLHLRANLFADGYKKLIAASPKREPAPTTRDGWVAEAEKKIARAKSSAGTGKETEYDVLLVQSVKTMIQKTSDVRAMITANIQRALELPARTASNPNVRLVALSEFFMTGQGGFGYRSPITLQRLAVRYPGPEMELLSEFALKHKVYLAGSSFEIDDKLPGYVFNSAFILNDSGDLIHRYRKIQCADVWGSLPDTTPSTIYQKYLDTYGYDFLFPVVDTPIGRLGTMVCFDQAHPEVARMLVKAGAEVIIHPSSEGHGAGRRGWDLARQTRAFENTAYLLSPLPGGEHFSENSKYEHTNQMRGYSKLVNFDGTIQGELDTPGAAVLAGTIDLLALRRARSNPHLNYAVWDDPSVYVDVYAGDVGLPNNLGNGDPLDNPYRGMKPLRKVLASYLERGIFVAPGETSSRTLAVPGKAQPDFDKPDQPRPTQQRPKTLADLEKMDGEYIQV